MIHQAFTFETTAGTFGVVCVCNWMLPCYQPDRYQARRAGDVHLLLKNGQYRKGSPALIEAATEWVFNYSQLDKAPFRNTTEYERRARLTNAAYYYLQACIG